LNQVNDQVTDIAARTSARRFERRSEQPGDEIEGRVDLRAALEFYSLAAGNGSYAES
jgi:hypothetical protein